MEVKKNTWCGWNLIHRKACLVFVYTAVILYKRAAPCFTPSDKQHHLLLCFGNHPSISYTASTVEGQGGLKPIPACTGWDKSPVNHRANTSKQKHKCMLTFTSKENSFGRKLTHEKEKKTCFLKCVKIYSSKPIK